MHSFFSSNAREDLDNIRMSCIYSLDIYFATIIAYTESNAFLSSSKIRMNCRVAFGFTAEFAHDKNLPMSKVVV